MRATADTGKEEMQPQATLAVDANQATEGVDEVGEVSVPDEVKLTDEDVSTAPAFSPERPQQQWVAAKTRIGKRKVSTSTAGNEQPAGEDGAVKRKKGGVKGGVAGRSNWSGHESGTLIRLLMDHVDGPRVRWPEKNDEWDDLAKLYMENMKRTTKRGDNPPREMDGGKLKDRYRTIWKMKEPTGNRVAPWWQTAGQDVRRKEVSLTAVGVSGAERATPDRREIMVSAPRSEAYSELQPSSHSHLQVTVADTEQLVDDEYQDQYTDDPENEDELQLALQRSSAERIADIAATRMQLLPAHRTQSDLTFSAPSHQHAPPFSPPDTPSSTASSSSWSSTTIASLPTSAASISLSSSSQKAASSNNTVNRRQTVDKRSEGIEGMVQTLLEKVGASLSDTAQWRLEQVRERSEQRRREEEQRALLAAQEDARELRFQLLLAKIGAGGGQAASPSAAAVTVPSEITSPPARSQLPEQ